MYCWRHIVQVNNTNTQPNSRKTTPRDQKDAQNKLMKGLLDLIILQFLNTQPMHGYQIMASIRKSFGVNFGPSTIYQLLGQLEEKGHIISKWNTDSQRPKRIYMLTEEGKSILNFIEDSFNLICKKISAQAAATPITETVCARTLRPEKLRAPEQHISQRLKTL